MVHVETLSNVSRDQRGPSASYTDGPARHSLRMPTEIVWRDVRVFRFATELLLPAVLLGVRRHGLVFRLEGAVLGLQAGQRIVPSESTILRGTDGSDGQSFRTSLSRFCGTSVIRRVFTGVARPSAQRTYQARGEPF